MTLRCELCGSPVLVISKRDGTHHVEPLTDAIAEDRARLREALVELEPAEPGEDAVSRDKVLDLLSAADGRR